MSKHEVRPGTVTKIVFEFADESTETEFRDDLMWNVGVRTLRDKMLSSLRSIERRVEKPKRVMLADYSKNTVDPTKITWYNIVYFNNDPRFQIPQQRISRII